MSNRTAKEHETDRETLGQNLVKWHRSQAMAVYKDLIRRQRTWEQELRNPIPGLTSSIPLPPQKRDFDQQADRATPARYSNQNVPAPRAPTPSITPRHTEEERAPVESRRSQDEPEKEKKTLIRRQLEWQANERDVLRRSLLMYGVGRTEKVRVAMKGTLKTLRHTLADIMDASYHFLRVVGTGTTSDPSIRPWAQKKLADVARENVVDLSEEVSHRVGTWERVDDSSCVRGWCRKLKMLDQLGDVIHMLAQKENLPEAFAAVDSLKDATVPADWWTRESDFALMSGVYRHGYGNYDQLHNDPQFSMAFKVPVEASRHGGQEAQWPDAYVLTRRIKRLLEHLHKLCKKDAQKTVAPSSAAEVVAPRKAAVWLKKDKLEFLRVLMMWGLISPQGNGVSWRLLRQKSSFSGFTSKSDPAMELGLSSILLEAQQLAGGKPSFLKDKVPKLKFISHPSFCPCLLCKLRKKALSDSQSLGPSTGSAASPSAGPPILTITTAAKLLERLGLLEVLRWSLQAYRSDWNLVGLSTYRSHELPHWWLPGVHDKALVKGVHKYGFGSWDDILKDPVLPFSAHVRAAAMDDPATATAPQDLDPMGFGSNEGDWGEEGPLAKPDPTDSAPGAGPGLQGTGWSSTLTPKIVVKRLRYIEKLFRRPMIKQKKVTKRKSEDEREEQVQDSGGSVQAASDGGPVVSLKAAIPRPQDSEDYMPKKYKYTRAVEVLRGDDGKPKLPLQLTDRMQIIHLGRIVTDRPGWHTERHIFPAGFTSIREHASMVHLNSRCRYRSSIVDTGTGGPVFRIQPLDSPDNVVDRDSASGAWVAVCTAVNRLRNIERDKVAINGTDMFGLSHPSVCRLIQELPGVEKCSNFRPELSFSRFEKPLPSTNPARGVRSAEKTSRGKQSKATPQGGLLSSADLSSLDWNQLKPPSSSLFGSASPLLATGSHDRLLVGAPDSGKNRRVLDLDINAPAAEQQPPPAIGHNIDLNAHGQGGYVGEEEEEQEEEEEEEGEMVSVISGPATYGLTTEFVTPPGTWRAAREDSEDS